VPETVPTAPLTRSVASVPFDPLPAGPFWETLLSGPEADPASLVAARPAPIPRRDAIWAAAFAASVRT